jgi:hypothetical protein
VTSTRAKEEWKSNGYKKDMRRGAREERGEAIRNERIRDPGRKSKRKANELQ